MSKIENAKLKKMYTLLIIFFFIAILPLFLKIVLSFFNLSLHSGYWGWIVYALFQYIFPIIILAQYFNLRFKEHRIAKSNKFSIIWTILFVVLYFFLMYIIHKNFAVAPSENQRDILSTLNNPSIFGIQVELLVAALLGPIFEELICRGLIMNEFFYNSKYGLDMVISTLVFSLLHQHQNLVVLLPYIVFGFLLSLLYRITGKIQYSIIMHMSVNIILMWPLIQDNIIIFL